MRVFDCFMYYNEDVILDLRLNYLDPFVDFFVIVESKFNHKGEKKELNFDINKFKRFKHKIKYLILDHNSPEIEAINNQDSEDEKSRKFILNGYRRDNYQRNYLINGLKDANQEDLIIISDIDEIPKVENINFNKISNQIIIFVQIMCYYKFNLYQKNYKWFGSRACKKIKLVNPQWLRDIKPKKYPFWRLDNFFSNKKYSNIRFINDGGWHFSYLNTPQLIEQKLKTYTHHREYDLNPIGVDNIAKRIKNRESVYNLTIDKRANKFSGGIKLDILEQNYLPKYIIKNKEKFIEWLA